MFLAILVIGEAQRYFKGPVAPDEKHLVARDRHIIDPTRAPEAMFAECRAEGKLLHASKTDGPDWIYECI